MCVPGLQSKERCDTRGTWSRARTAAMLFLGFFLIKCALGGALVAIHGPPKGLGPFLPNTKEKNVRNGDGKHEIFANRDICQES